MHRPPSHRRLPLVQVLDDEELGQARMGELTIDEAAWDHSDDLATGCQGRIRDRAHQPETAAAVDDADPALGERCSGQRGGGGVARIMAARGTAEHADRTDAGWARRRALGHGQNPSSRRIGLIRRAARPRCETACFSAAVHSPNVRPPGGSLSGSKIGS